MLLLCLLFSRLRFIDAAVAFRYTPATPRRYFDAAARCRILLAMPLPCRYAMPLFRHTPIAAAAVAAAVAARACCQIDIYNQNNGIHLFNTRSIT